eukprot:361044-Chlamydomonas_euryale.AAC.2
MGAMPVALILTGRLTCLTLLREGRHAVARTCRAARPQRGAALVEGLQKTGGLPTPRGLPTPPGALGLPTPLGRGSGPARRASWQARQSLLPITLAPTLSSAPYNSDSPQLYLRLLTMQVPRPLGVCTSK